MVGSVAGTYNQKSHDSGDAHMGGAKQSPSKFSKGIHQPTDNMKKPSTPASKPKTISEQRSRP